LTKIQKYDIINTTNEREVITMSERRQKMLDRIIRIYGYEHPITIRFAQILESAEEF
jgi:hypothetical protein